MRNKNVEQNTQKFRGRIYYEVPITDIQPGDVVIFIDEGKYTRAVVSVTKINLLVEQPKSFKQRTWRISRKKVQQVWRWRGNLNESEQEHTGSSEQVSPQP
jgi:hypothetical protein